MALDGRSPSNSPVEAGWHLIGRILVIQSIRTCCSTWADVSSVGVTGARILLCLMLSRADRTFHDCQICLRASKRDLLTSAFASTTHCPASNITTSYSRHSFASMASTPSFTLPDGLGHTVRDYYHERYPVPLGATASEFSFPAADTPCECKDCLMEWYGVAAQTTKKNRFFAFWAIIDDDEIVAKTVKHLVRLNEIALKALRELMRICGDTFMKEWKKKSRDARALLIKEAAPEMAKDARAYFELYYSCTAGMQFGDLIHKRRMNRWMLLLPWLNVELLRDQPAAIYALIHFRTAYHPASWAAWDSRQIDHGWIMGFFDHEFSQKCVAVHEKAFGEVVEPDLNSLHGGIMMGYPRARLVLEAQRYLSQFLVKLVVSAIGNVQIPKYIQESPPPQERWVGATQAGFRHQGSKAIWTDFVSEKFAERIAYTHQAFDKPPKFNFEHVRMLTHARLTWTEDHIFDLQTNMKYLKHYVDTLSTNTMMRYAPHEISAGIVLFRYIGFLVKSWHLWHYLWEQIGDMRKTLDRLEGEMSPDQPLPRDMDDAVAKVELVSKCVMDQHCMRLIEHAPFLKDSIAAPRVKAGVNKTFKGKAKATAKNYSKTRVLETLSFDSDGSESAAERYHGDPLTWCLNAMTHRTDEVEEGDGFDHCALFAFLESLLAETPEELNRLDDIIMEQLSNIAAAHKILMAVRLIRPRHRWDKKPAPGAPWLPVEFNEDRKLFYNTKLTNACQGLYASLLKFDVDAPAAPRKRWDHMKESRAIIEPFWNDLVEHIRAQLLGQRLEKGRIDAFVVPILATPSSEYARMREREEADILRALHPDQAAELMKEMSARRSSKISALLSEETTGAARTRQRLQYQDPPAADSGVDVGPATRLPPLKIPVEKQHLLFFRQMFPDATDNNKSKKVKWSSFVDAMLGAGCALQPWSGSATNLLFEDSRNGKRKVIVFHKGHADVLDAILLRIFGRRLRGSSGWTRDTFALSMKIKEVRAGCLWFPAKESCRVLQHRLICHLN